jgi:hypothetical protein
LIAENDQDDFIILRLAFEEIKISVNIPRVENGSQVFNYLDGIADKASFPDLILPDRGYRFPAKICRF